MIAPRASLAVFTMALLLSSCRKPAVESYRAAKDPVATAPEAGAATMPAPPNAAPGAAASAPGGNAMANTAVATASGTGLTWTAPAHWIVKSGSAMRKGSYTVKGEGGEADMSITAFPGDVGGDLANLNRWRGQIGLPPVSQAELESTTQHLDRNGLHMTVVDIAGTGATAQGILGAMVPHEGATWFFKLTGPAALVAKEKAAFAAFLDTVKPSAAK